MPTPDPRPCGLPSRDPRLSRRDFLGAACLSFGMVVAAATPGAAAATRRADPLRIGLVAPPGGEVPRLALSGVVLGSEEAARTAMLIGRGIEVRALSAESVGREASLAGIQALIGGFGLDSALATARAAAAGRIPFLNIGAPQMELRDALCGPNLYHVEASDAMYAAARSSPGAAAGGTPVTWHPTLERFGAAQLNDRFRARFGEGMDGAAWAGWMAVKILWEAHLRVASPEPGGLNAYLDRAATTFDGHKGWPLSFRAADRQLRQPLYLVSSDTAGGRVVAEVPARPTGDGTPSATLLDALTPLPVATCRPSTMLRP